MNDNEILRRTSRSFYLTIRFLPRRVRGEVALAYLLARATDTIADSSVAETPRRLAMLNSARASLQAPSVAGYEASEWAHYQRDPAEQQLLFALPRLWSHMHAQRDKLVAGVLGSILEGQIFDLQRFKADRSPLTDDELVRYTYLVAGSVGEFWTDLCAARLGAFAAEPLDVMRRCARHYGQALQLVNILRDLRMDDALGRSYIAATDTARWTEQARAWLADGAAYCAALRSGRLRYATLLPALLGERTLLVVTAQAADALTSAKVSRSELRKLMFRALPVWWSAQRVRTMVAAASE